MKSVIETVILKAPGHFINVREINNIHTNLFITLFVITWFWI